VDIGICYNFSLLLACLYKNNNDYEVSYIGTNLMNNPQLNEKIICGVFVCCRKLLRTSIFFSVQVHDFFSGSWFVFFYFGRRHWLTSFVLFG
jgi:hypothetical protein